MTGPVRRWELAASLDLLYRRLPPADRCAAAAGDGFRCVEILFPASYDPEGLRSALMDYRLEPTLLAVYPGDVAAGTAEELLAGIEDDLDLAARLGVPQVQLVLGEVAAGQEREPALEAVAEVLYRAGERAVPHGVDLLIEPVSRASRPGALVGTPAEAAALLHRAAHPNLWLQFDTCQVALAGLDPAGELRAVAEVVRHVQVADAPGRTAPGSGSIDFAAVFQALAEVDYDGRIGLEYHPSGLVRTEIDLWIQRYRRDLE